MSKGVVGYSAKSTKRLVIIIVLVVVAVVAGYFILFSSNCTTYECFQNSMKKCSKATYINEQPEASWRYKIIGVSSEGCGVNVKLLQAKRGELEIDDLTGGEMNCYYPVGTSAYPEKDLSKCHGLLKEELQNIIIKKLYVYVIENLGKLDEKLKSAV